MFRNILLGYFDSLGLKKLPSIQSLKQEYAALDAEGRKIYPALKTARAEMIELLTAKNNVERILGMDAERQNRQKKTERGCVFSLSGRTQQTPKAA